MATPLVPGYVYPYIDDDGDLVEQGLYPAGGGPTVETVTSTSTTPYTVIAFDQNIYVDATASSMAVNLPATTGSGRVLTVKKVAGVVANTVTLQASGAELIDGANTQVIVNQYDALTIQDADAGVWYIK